MTMPSSTAIFSLLMYCCCIILVALSTLRMRISVDHDDKTQTRRRRLEQQQTHHHHHHHGLFEDFQATENSNIVKQIRQEIYEMCRNDTISAQMLSWTLRSKFRSSLIPSSLTHEDSLRIEPCRYTFLDLGSNIGDSLYKFIDSGFARCTKQERSIDDNILFSGNNKRGNPLIKWALHHFKQQSASMPEDYCYFGVEGNPLFTENLHELERNIMRTFPRPVRRVHFFTETVGTDRDGPTTLYLDTVNSYNNYWGSSLLKTHIDVVKSSNHQNQSVTAAAVNGMSSPTLLRLTTLQQGGHLFLKIDIEGAEYGLLNGAADILCEYVNNGVSIDILLELHKDELMMGGGDDIGLLDESIRMYQSKTKPRLLECGVNLVEGEAG